MGIVCIIIIIALATRKIIIISLPIIIGGLYGIVMSIVNWNPIGVLLGFIMLCCGVILQGAAPRT